MNTVAHGFAELFNKVIWLLPPFLAALTVHEFSHAFTANWLGDGTARRKGRLSLNPLVHIDPLGLLCLFLFRIGWAKPVPINPLNFKKPRLYSVISAVAGPLSNFALAWVCINVQHLIMPGGYLLTFLQTCTYINCMLGVFNLIPLFPLDGSHVLEAALVMHYPHVIVWLRRYAIFILLVLFYLPGFRIFLSQAIQAAHYTLEMISL